MTKTLLLILLSIMLLIPNFFDAKINGKNVYTGMERYDPLLSYINSVDKLELHTDSLAFQKNIAQNSPEYFILLEYVISQRFFHGFSRYTLKGNWVASVAEYTFGMDLSCKVLPDEILQHRGAGCSQQAIVMMEMAKRKHVDYRSVGFPHHYTLELNIQNKWYFFDPDKEPNISKEERSTLPWQGMGSSLKKHYSSTFRDHEFVFGSHIPPLIGKVNAEPAPRLKFFHGITLALSRICWLFPLAILFALYRRKIFSGVTKPSVEMILMPRTLLPA